MAANPRLVGAAVGAAIAIASAFVNTMEGTRYAAYRDFGNGVWTICDGHTRGVKDGDIATPDQCEEFRRQDLFEASTAIDRCIHTPLTDKQRAAFLSAVFNLGPVVVCGSTLQRKANAGDVLGACAELTDARNSKGEKVGFTYAAGKRWPGLIKRRAAERAMCEDSA